VTTRRDGHITIEFGWSAGDWRQGNFLNVTTSKSNLNPLLALLLGGGS
jgi:hypothetical protein